MIAFPAQVSSATAIADKAYEGGDTAWLITVILMVLVVLLGSAFWWLLKERMAERRHKEDALERRLKDGTTTMKTIKDEFQAALSTYKTQFTEAVGEIKSALTQLQANDVHQSIHIAKALSADEFNNYRESHKLEHDQLERTVCNLKDSMAEVNDQMRESMAEMHGCVDAIKDVSAKILEAQMMFGKR